MPTFTIPLHESNDCHTPPGSPEGGQFCAVGVQTLQLKAYDPATKTTRSAGAPAAWYSFGPDAPATPVRSTPFTKALGDAFEQAVGWEAKFALLRQHLQPPDPPPGSTVVYRLGRGGSLRGRNAANLEGLARFIDQEGGDFADARDFVGRTISTYVVKIGAQGAYEPQRRQGFREG